MGVTYGYKPPLSSSRRSPAQSEGILGNSNNGTKKKAFYDSDQDNSSGINASLPIALGHTGGVAVQVVIPSPIIAILAHVDITNTIEGIDGSNNQTAITPFNQSNDD